MASDLSQTDVVVVGSGVGGLSAAFTVANETDCAVTVLEKADVLGGSSGLSSGQLWIPANHLTDADDVKAGVDYLTALAGDLYSDRTAARRYAETARSALRYFEETRALQCQPISGMPDYHEPYPGATSSGRYLEPVPLDGATIPGREKLPHSPHLPGGATVDELLNWGGPFTYSAWDWEVINRRRADDVVTLGTALIGHFLRALADHDVTVRTGATVTRLYREDGRVAGVELKGAALPSRVPAPDGVVLATGAYDWNDELIEAFEGTPAEHVVSAAVPTATGDGLQMAAQEGAKLGVYPPVGSAKGFFVAVPDETFLDAPLYRYCYNVGLPHALAVDADGERFCDESFYPRQASELYDPTGEYDHFPMYMVFDETYRQRYPLANYPPGTDYPDGFLRGRADSLEGLAEQLDVDPGIFAATVERFNGHAREGVDPDFGRGDNRWAQVWCGDPDHEPNPNLGPVETPPFYAVRLYVGLSSMGNVGLVVDDNIRVLDWHDEPIRGLYATGSVLAPVEWGVGYQSGLQNGRSLAYGHLAGRHIAATIE